MKDPVLVIMAAGMGSRYGGLKQIDPVDEQGHIIMDFSIYDAIRAGFRKVIFVIRKEHHEAFRNAIGDRISGNISVEYVFQELTDIPEGFSVPEGREKPWGTGHAVYSCRDAIDGPFAVINADDYYGPEAFSLIYDTLASSEDDDKQHYAMIGYRLGNTLTENGSVSRGICTVDEKGHLCGICERVYIVKRGDGAAYSEDGGESFTEISPEETASMNFWGFSGSFLKELGSLFEDFQRENVPSNPLKAEFYLPSAVSSLIDAGKADVIVRKSADKWFGVTYQEDKPQVCAAIAGMKEKGIYPSEF